MNSDSLISRSVFYRFYTCHLLIKDQHFIVFLHLTPLRRKYFLHPTTQLKMNLATLDQDPPQSRHHVHQLGHSVSPRPTRTLRGDGNRLDSAAAQRQTDSAGQGRRHGLLPARQRPRRHRTEITPVPSQQTTRVLRRHNITADTHSVTNLRSFPPVRVCGRPHSHRTARLQRL